MRIDFVSIFPDFFQPLTLSLPGKAQDAGLLEVHAHDLRTWTHDRHRTVDDSPYGGGPGMVMLPQPWGEALDALLEDDSLVVVPTPSGQRFDQTLAAELALEQHVVFLCGRYEGIDQRVLDATAQSHRIVEISLGDYVLNGGEVAALAITEAVIRLIPGFMGNPESLVEESHAAGLLEYPVYTRPETWRGFQVPEVLLSGNHGAVESWRQERALVRTVERRPDLMSAPALTTMDIAPVIATPADAAELLVLTRACFIEDHLADPDLMMPQFRETLDDVRAALGVWRIWVVRSAGRLVGSVRAHADGDDWHIARVMTAPDLYGRGIGRALLSFAELQAPDGLRRFVLEAAKLSERNQRFYKKAGYRPVDSSDLPVGLGRYAKRRSIG